MSIWLLIALLVTFQVVNVHRDFDMAAGVSRAEYAAKRLKTMRTMWLYATCAVLLVSGLLYFFTLLRHPQATLVDANLMGPIAAIAAAMLAATLLLQWILPAVYDHLARKVESKASTKE